HRGGQRTEGQRGGDGLGVVVDGRPRGRRLVESRRDQGDGTVGDLAGGAEGVVGGAGARSESGGVGALIARGVLGDLGDVPLRAGGGQSPLFRRDGGGGVAQRLVRGREHRAPDRREFGGGVLPGAVLPGGDVHDVTSRSGTSPNLVCFVDLSLCAY